MAYNLTQSVNFALASSEFAYRADDPDILGNLTLECAIKPDSLPGTGGTYRIATKDNFGAQRTYGWSIQNTAGQYFFTLRWFTAGGNGTVTSDVLSISAGNWYRVGVTRSTGGAGPVVFHLDNATVGGGNIGTDAFVNSTADFMIGAGGSNGSPENFFDGNISLFRAWTVVRTNSEIYDNQCEVLGATAGLEAEWTFDGVYTDNSGNGNTLTAVNTPTFEADLPSVCATPVVSSVSNSAFTLLGVGN